MRIARPLLVGLLALLCACEREPRPLPGLTIAPDGRLISANLREFRARCETGTGKLLADGFPGWRATVRIAEEPYPAADGESGYWQTLTAAVELRATTAGAARPEAVEVVLRSQQVLQRWVRGPAIPFVQVTFPE